MTDRSRTEPCPQCGTVVTALVDFCPNCGFFFKWAKGEPEEEAEANTARLPGEETEQHPAPPPTPPPPSEVKVTCPECGADNEASRTFCHRCGTVLRRAPQPPPPPPPPAPTPNRRWVYWILGGLGAALVVVLIVSLIANDTPTGTSVVSASTTSPDQPTTTSPEATTPTEALGEPQDTAAVSARRVEAPIAIDGDSSDWTAVTDQYLSTHAWFRVENWTGPEDLSVVWRLAWDQDFLYVLAETIDDVHSQSQTSRLWEGDSLDLEFDVGAADDGDPGVNGDDYQWILSPGNFADVPATFVLFRGTGEDVFPGPTLEAPEFELVAHAKDPGGFVLEARIPWAAMDVTPEPGMVMGLALSASDNDNPGTASQETMLSNSPDVRVARPLTWGTLTLLP